MEIQKELNKDMVKNILEQGKRMDGRKKLDYREIELEKEPVANAEGSALCRIGKTQVLSAVKVDLGTPFPDRPDEGIMSTSCEFTPLGSPIFEPGPPRVEAIEVARVVDRGIRSAEMVDLSKLIVTPGELAKAVFVDLWILDYDGNLFDAAMLASVSALLNTRMPKVEDNKIIRNEIEGKLNPSSIPVSTTFAKIGEAQVLDPTFAEESGAQGLMIIANQGESVCSVQKSGKAGYVQKDIMELMDISFEKGRQLRELAKK